MLPAAAVSGWYFAHPQSRYFAVDRIARDQVEAYAARKGMTHGRSRTLARAESGLRSAGIGIPRNGGHQRTRRPPTRYDLGSRASRERRGPVCGSVTRRGIGSGDSHLPRVTASTSPANGRATTWRAAPAWRPPSIRWLNCCWPSYRPPGPQIWPFRFERPSAIAGSCDRPPARTRTQSATSAGQPAAGLQRCVRPALAHARWQPVPTRPWPPLRRSCSRPVPACRRLPAAKHRPPEALDANPNRFALHLQNGDRDMRTDLDLLLRFP